MCIRLYSSSVGLCEYTKYHQILWYFDCTPVFEKNYLKLRAFYKTYNLPRNLLSNKGDSRWQAVYLKISNNVFTQKDRKMTINVNKVIRKDKHHTRFNKLTDLPHRITIGVNYHCGYFCIWRDLILGTSLFFSHRENFKFYNFHVHSLTSNLFYFTQSQHVSFIMTSFDKVYIFNTPSMIHGVYLFQKENNKPIYFLWLT